MRMPFQTISDSSKEPSARIEPAWRRPHAKASGWRSWHPARRRRSWSRTRFRSRCSTIPVTPASRRSRWLRVAAPARCRSSASPRTSRTSASGSSGTAGCASAAPPTRSSPPAARSNATTGEDGQLIWFDDRDLGASAAIALPTHANLPAGMSLPFIVAIAFGDTLEDAVRETVVLAGEAHDLVGAEVRERRSWWQGVGRAAESDRAIRRAAAYALDCAAARAGDDLVAVLADHEILPLVWTRDAYYVCRMLLELAPHDERVRTVVDGFLRWLFDAAERPGGWWPRASLANGVAKDPVFQLDRQLYPFLLLEDHARLTGEPELADRYATRRDEIIRALLA